MTFFESDTGPCFPQRLSTANRSHGQHGRTITAPKTPGEIDSEDVCGEHRAKVDCHGFFAQGISDGAVPGRGEDEPPPRPAEMENPPKTGTRLCCVPPYPMLDAPRRP